VGADLYNLDSNVAIVGGSIGGVYNNGGNVSSIDDLLARVAALSLNGGQRNSPTSKLQAAQRSLAKARPTPRGHQPGACVTPINALVNSGRLDENTAAALISEADSLMDAIS